MSRISRFPAKKTVNKKALVLAISSVLAGWVAAGGSYALAEHYTPTDWPPNKQKVIDKDNKIGTIPKGGNIIIKQRCEGGKKPCNISLNDNATLNNAGTITVESSSITVTGSTDDEGKSPTLNNSGTINVKKYATGIVLKKGNLKLDNTGIIKVAKDAITGVHINEGFLTLSGSGSLEKADSSAAITIANIPTVPSPPTAPSIVAGIHIDGTTVTGKIIGGKGPGNLTDTLGLDNNAVINGDVIQIGQLIINGKSDDKVKRDTWTINGQVIAPVNIKVVDGEIDALNAMGTARGVGVKSAPASRTLNVITYRYPDQTTTVGADHIKTLHISSNARLRLEKDAKSAVNIDNVVIGADASNDWVVEGWATGLKKLEVGNSVENLYVRDKTDAVDTTKKFTETLFAVPSTDGLNIVTNEKKISNLRIEGDNTRLKIGTAKQTAANIDNVYIGPKINNWTVDGWATGLANLDASSAVEHLHVSDTAKNAVTADSMTKTLRAASAKDGLTLTTVGTSGKINHLHIHGAAKIKGDATVQTVTVNSANNWKLAGTLNGVQSVTANVPLTEIGKAESEATIDIVAVAEDTPSISKGSKEKVLAISTKEGAPDISGAKPGLIKTLMVGPKAEFADVTNVSEINIASNGWSSKGVVTNANTVAVGFEEASVKVAAINSVSVTTKATAKPDILNLTFNKQADVHGFININTLGHGTIDALDFSEASHRPSLRYTPSGKVDYSKIKGNPNKTDTVVINASLEGPTELPQGFTGVVYKGRPKSIIPNLKRLELEAIPDKTVITSSDISGSFVIHPPFTSSMPDAFHLRTSSDKNYSISFDNPKRPTTTFEIAGGTVTKLTGNTGKKDKLIISGGGLQGDVDTIDSLTIRGKEWSADGTFSKLNHLMVDKTGVVEAINTIGITHSSKPVIGPNTLLVKTINSQPLPVSVLGTLDRLNITSNATLGDIQLNGGTVSIDDVKSNANWRLGQVIDAGALEAPTHSFKRVTIGKGLNEAIPDNKHLVLNTETKDINLSVDTIDTLDIANGARVDSVMGAVHHVALTGMQEWSVKKTIPMAGDTKGVSSISVGKDVKVAGLGGKKAALQATFELPKKDAGKTLLINNAGMISNGIHLEGIAAPKTVQLTQSGGFIKGNVYGVNYAEFNGNSHFEGNFKTPVKSVRITGKLTSNGADALELRHAAPSGPTLAIEKGGELMTNRRIRVDGTYSQDGDIHFHGDLTLKDAKPLVTATSMHIGDNARLFLKQGVVTKGVVLMQSSEVINQPVQLMTLSEQYDHYIANLSQDKKTIVVDIKPTSTFVKSLAMTGGAPEAATKALEVAAGRKNAKEPRGVNDPLSTFTTKYATTPRTAALLAEQLTPDNSASVVSAAQGAQNQAGKAIATRTAHQHSGMNSGDIIDAGGFWVQYAHNDATQDSRDGVFGFKAKTKGFTLGVDSELNDMTDIGFAYTYAKSDISGKDGGSGNGVDSKNHVFTLYSAFNQGPVFVDGRLSYATGKNDARRSVMNHRIEASYDSKNWGIGLNGGVDLPISQQWHVQPVGAFNYYRIKLDDYAEKATTSYLAYDKVNNDNYTVLELGVGLKLLGDLHSSGSTSFKPQAMLMAFHDFKDDPVSMQAHYGVGGETFVVNGAKREQNRFLGAASLDVSPKDNMVISASVSYDWAKKYDSKGVLLRARYDF